MVTPINPSTFAHTPSFRASLGHLPADPAPDPLSFPPPVPVPFPIPPPLPVPRLGLPQVPHEYEGVSRVKTRRLMRRKVAENGVLDAMRISQLN